MESRQPSPPSGWRRLLGAPRRLLGAPIGTFTGLVVAGIVTFIVVIGLGWGIVAAVQSRIWWLVVTLGALLAWLLVHFIPELTVRGDEILDRSTAPTPEKRWEAKKAVRDALVAAIAGVSVIAAVVLAASTLDLNARQGELSNQQQQLNNQQQQLDRDSKHSDQFMKAVDMMAAASSTADVRAGGIYSLEQLGLASPDDRRRITETLAAYLRGHSQRPRNAPTSPPDPPTADVQAAISVLARNGWAQQLHMPLDLRGVDLRAANLRNADLAGADLTKALFTYADLTKADLSNADLAGATFSGRTILTQATLSSAVLVGAYMEDVDASAVKGLTGDQLAPVSISAQTILPGYMHTPPPPPPPPNGQSLTIEAPVEGDHVPIAPDVHGTMQDVPADITLWMVTDIPDDTGNHRYYPQGVSFPDYRTGINRTSASEWCKEKGYAGSAADTGKALSLLVVGANKTANANFLTYLRVGPTVGLGFPAWRYLPSGLVLYGQVNVMRDAKNLTDEQQRQLEARQEQACPHSPH